jgi:hypothetical protein
MGPILGFLGTVAAFVFLMGLVTNAKGTATVINATASGITNLFTLELGKVPTAKTG